MKKLLAPLFITSALVGGDLDGVELASLNKNISDNHKASKHNSNNIINKLNNLDTTKSNNTNLSITKGIEDSNNKQEIIESESKNSIDEILNTSNYGYKVIRGHKIYTKTGAKINDDIAETLVSVALILDKYIPEDLSFKGTASSQKMHPNEFSNGTTTASVYYNYKF